MAIAMLIGLGVAMLLLCGDMARVCFEDGAWALAVAAVVMAGLIVLGVVMGCIAVSQA